MKKTNNSILVLAVLGFGWNHVLPDAQAATIDLAAAAGVFLANTVAGGDGTLASAKSGTQNSYEGSWSRLTDGARGTKWAALGANAWAGPYDGKSGFHFTLPAPAKMQSIRFFTEDSAPHRNPMTMTIEGSKAGDPMSGASWTLLYTGSTGLEATPNNSAGRAVNFTNTTAYTRYRVLFLAAGGLDVVQLADVVAADTPDTAKEVPVLTQTPAVPEEVIDGFTDTPMQANGKWHVHDPARPQPQVITPGAMFSQGAPAPSDAEILFDGKGLAKWQKADGGDAVWKTTADYVETAPQGGGIRTRGKWADFQLHVEFATPNPPNGTSQGRGNSGILINKMYEVQVLDSYRAKTYADGQAAAIYGQSPPLVNSSKPPGEWQSYDILFESPRWNEKGELIKKAIITVLHNGVVVQNRYEFTGGTDGISDTVPWRTLSKYPAPHPPECFIELQDHANPVRFRNIWIRSMHLGENQ